MAEVSFTSAISKNDGKIGLEAFKAFFPEDQHGPLLTKMFNLLGPDGYITAESFQKIANKFSESNVVSLVQQISTKTPAAEAVQILNKFDDDGNSVISLYEFPALLKAFKCSASLEDMYLAFEYLDTDESYSLEPAEFEEFLWDSWIGNPDFASIDQLINGAIAGAVAEQLKKKEGGTNLDVEKAQNCLKSLKLENATAEGFKAILDHYDLKHESEEKNHDVDDFVWDYIQPFNGESIVRCSTLFAVEADLEEDDWPEEFLGDLCDEIREMYDDTAKLMGTFSEGKLELSKAHFMKLMGWLGLSENEAIFQALDKDGDGAISIKELGPMVLKASKTLNTKSEISILKEILGSTA